AGLEKRFAVGRRARACGMEERPHPRCGPHFSPAFAETFRRTRPRTARASLLRHRISRQPGRERARARRLLRCAQSSGKFPRLESREFSGGEIIYSQIYADDKPLLRCLLSLSPKESALICEIRGQTKRSDEWPD